MRAKKELFEIVLKDFLHYSSPALVCKCITTVTDREKITRTEAGLLKANVMLDVYNFNVFNNHRSGDGSPHIYFVFPPEKRFSGRIKYLEAKINGTFDYETFQP